MTPTITIEKPDWIYHTSSEKMVRIHLPGYDASQLIADIGNGHLNDSLSELYDCEDGGWANFMLRGGYHPMGIKQEVGYVAIQFYVIPRAEGDDALDGTVEPTELGLSDILEVARSTRMMLKLMKG